MIREEGSIAVMGLASTTGTVQRDFELGSKRLHAVIEYLHKKFGHRFLVSKHVSAGKIMALAFDEAHLAGGTKDNQESDLWRAVVLNAWNRSLPPPIPTDVDASDPVNNPNWSETVGKDFDKAAWFLGFVDFALDVAEVAAAAAAAIADLTVSVVDTLAVLPLTWGSSDFYAEQNGRIQGRADAIQDMADQFKDTKLDNTRLADWPAVQVPAPHIPANPQPTTNQIFWRQGQMEGLKQAVELILKMEQNPKSVTLPSGKHERWTGRIWLHMMSRRFGANVGIETVINPTNENLKKQGKHEFPTRP